MITYTCAFCQTIYTTKYKSYSKKQYCTIACSNKDKPRRPPTNNCKKCSKPINTHKKYCSFECKEEILNARKLEKANTVKKPVVLSEATIAKYNNKAKNRCRELKRKAVEYKGGCCQCCGYNKCVNALDFHHIDPKKKDFGIGTIRKCWENLKVELDKCVLVCSNCHREIHAGITNIPQQSVEITPLVGIAPTLFD